MRNRLWKCLLIVCAVALVFAASATALAEENLVGSPEETPADTGEITENTDTTPSPEAETTGEKTAEEPADLTEAETLSEGTEKTDGETTKNDKEQSWFEQLVEKFGESSLFSWIAVGVLIALGIMFFMITKSGKKWNARMLSTAALSIALSFVLSCLRLFRMPTHGSVTPGSMLPIMLFSLVYGVGPGMLTGLAYGLLQYIQDPSFLNIWQFILDYFIAFGALGLAGIGKDKSRAWTYISIPIAVFGRALAAILAGIMWANQNIEMGWGLTIGEWEFSSPLLFSMVYNGVYLIPETIICLVLATLIAKPVMRVMKTK